MVLKKKAAQDLIPRFEGQGLPLIFQKRSQDTRSKIALITKREEQRSAKTLARDQRGIAKEEQGIALKKGSFIKTKKAIKSPNTLLFGEKLSPGREGYIAGKSFIKEEMRKFFKQ